MMCFISKMNAILAKTNKKLSEDSAENKRRIEFKQQFPYFDAIVKANEIYVRTEDGIPVAGKKGKSKSFLSPYEAHMLRKKGYIEKTRDTDWKGIAYFASFTKKGEQVLRNRWSEWIDLAYE